MQRLYKGSTLPTDIAVPVKLSAINDQLIDALIGAIDSYFPARKMEATNALDSAKVPLSSSEAREYMLFSIVQLPTKFGLNPTATADEWQQLLAVIIDSQDLMKHKNSGTDIF